LGKKYTCYSCHTKFYDLGKPVPLCPKCGSDQRDADDKPVVTTTRGRRSAPAPVVEEVADEPEFGEAAETPAVETDEDEEIIGGADEREEEPEEEEEEEY
jgi:uncharacterized protein (TIGR02300 family)